MPFVNAASHSFYPGRRPGTIYNPNVLPNLQIWYNADVGAPPNFNQTYTSGSDISQWTDRSSTGHNANQSGGTSAKPNWYSNVQNGWGTVRFNGTSESLNINPVSASPQWIVGVSAWTVYMVFKMSSTTGTRPLLDTDVPLVGPKIYSNGTNWCVGAAGGVGTSSIAASTTGFHFISLIYDGTGATNADRLKMRFDDQPVALTYTGTVGTTIATGAKYLYWATDNTNYFAGDIGEVLVFSRALTGSETAAVESYLDIHWQAF
jgi:hypothetical protein